jgi:hypothetical protein
MRVVKKAVGKVLFSPTTFRLLQRVGVHLVPRHYYGPIPDTRQLEGREDVWVTDSALIGVDLND